MIKGSRVRGMGWQDARSTSDWTGTGGARLIGERRQGNAASKNSERGSQEEEIEDRDAYWLFRDGAREAWDETEDEECAIKQTELVEIAWLYAARERTIQTELQISHPALPR